MEPDGETTDEGLDRLDTIRNVLAVALVLGEAAYLWAVYKDTPNGLILRARARALLSKVAQPCQKCREYQKAKAHMHWQAYETVMGAREAQEAGDE